ncbi:alpha/beta hydrolase [Pseudoxanthomonas sacheonensis]|uniref:Pimeloyl-ACP methyl ester carboxylesterase n=1 Tax=Pseudoxanthomonas sacheonensis TaxID=443615 RepID=A0ABU1RRV6_9GAMM|nr:alpha/beta fold hydrolase [Pseudoxanthomonas sacheonensis]MDR6841035.1 pimeloyl-ACP methyl ester carboxylesterase [Pseudoxanthomonas sacheonensis]
MAAIAKSGNSTIVLKSLVTSLRFAVMRAGFAIGGWLMPKATLHRAFRLFGTPMPGARERALAADTLGARIEVLEHGEHRVAAYLWGDPARQPLVLLAHGWSSFGLRFAPWVRALRQAGYAVVTFDQLAHGRSSGRRATLPSFAETLFQVAKHYGPLAAVVGHSLGGAATMLALSKGMQAERTVLIAPAADPMAAADRFGRAVGLAQSLRDHLFDEWEKRFQLPVAGMQVHVNAPFIARPALVVHDLEDREVPWAEGERYARYWPQARLLTTTGLGHHRVAAEPQVIADALRFLKGESVGERVVSSPNLPFGIA